MGKIRGTHSTPGLYTKITDLQYTAASAGVTTLGLVGETQKGPAFEPVAISNWKQFQEYFGGTSTEKFKDTNMPKYELPYIAKSYLSASDSMYVCRVLGLSGYNAGPAFALTAKGDDMVEHLIGLLRLRGAYGTEYGDKCDPGNVGNFDTLQFAECSVGLDPYASLEFALNCEGVANVEDGDLTFSSIEGCKFTIVCNKGESTEKKYVVSLNPGDKEYIYNVLGSTPSDGKALLFVESLYDLELRSLLENGPITMNIVDVPVSTVNVVADPVNDFTIDANKLERKHLGMTFLDEEGKKIVKVVKQDGAYAYSDVIELGDGQGVMVLAKDSIYMVSGDEVVPFKSISNYREQFRNAMTPWFVSELKGDGQNIDIKKLFRFHTITDGNCANEQVKITIANVRPDEGTFDVLIRDFFDTDGNQTILESYKGVNLVPGSPKYLGLKVGTLNGDYPLSSKYVIAEIIENEITETCVPCGFVGYPVHMIEGVESPSFKYNTIYDEDIRVNKQTFGLSDITGVDVDMLYYKGVDAYTEGYDTNGYTKGFHLDSNISILNSDMVDGEFNLTLDGETIEADKWDTVSYNNTTVEGLAPVIGSESIMSGTIYEDVKVRKFTCYPYGGFDGWDIYRGQRTNTDNFKATKYKGTISHGYGATFGSITNGDGLRLNGRAISSDYYAYLAGVNQFANPEEYQINLFATPGIDYVNQKMLVDEVIDMIHNRQDCFYVITTPDKPSGAGESADEMFSATEVVSNLDTSAIDTYYASTYYPWVRYYDSSNARYISLPVTKDVLRNMADVDNKKYPWFAPAGIERGKVECTKARIFTKIEDSDITYDGRINPVKTFSADGVKIWGNKTLYSQDTPMNRINTVRLVLYMRKLIDNATKILFFDPNDAALKSQFDGILRPILSQIQSDRGIVDFRLVISQTPEQMDAHEISAELHIKPTPTLEYIEINFVVTPLGVQWDE